jgi:hypothetical protein
MLITYFKDPRILERYRSGLASIYLEDFIAWLKSQGYRRFMIRRHVRGVVHFTDWAEAEGLAVGDLDRAALNRLCSQLEERKSLRYPSGNRRYFCHSACLFVNFLEAAAASSKCRWKYQAGGVFCIKGGRSMFDVDLIVLEKVVVYLSGEKLGRSVGLRKRANVRR